ncbi:RNA-guided endonuclease InsQ/TnpB family protein [Streptomyces sp. NPDC127112]|uniref:RNA-guided endonuclease InsQ/TnpB family protein n=1 Tax=Streptomyces sp. NPDC127112 TaxID=3345364 RepID=UPI00362DDA2F
MTAPSFRGVGTSPVKRAFKYRFYPNDAQAAELSRTFGCVRKVYNLALAVRSRAWETGRERVGYQQTSALLTAWKQTEDLAFLAEVSSVPLQQTLRHLQAAFVNFWQGRAKHPRFKTKRDSRASAEYTRSAFRYAEGRLTLAKMAEPLDIVWSRPLPAGTTPSTVTVSRDPAGRWFVSLLCEDFPSAMPPATKAIGLDVGLTALVTLSTGEKIRNPRHERRERERLTRAQRALSRKEKGSKNREKSRIRVARIHARIADRRRDHLHKLTTRLVRENQTLVIEDLAVRDMLGNRRLARALGDAGWREFRRMLEYKAAWYGRRLIVVDRWFPSTRLCSACGALAGTVPLDIRTWTCVACGTTHDRDENAAINLLAAGLAVTACGAGVRPQRESSSRPGRSVVKQETPPVRVGTPSRQGGAEVTR